MKNKAKEQGVHPALPCETHPGGLETVYLDFGFRLTSAEPAIDFTAAEREFCSCLLAFWATDLLVLIVFFAILSPPFLYGKPRKQVGGVA